MKDILSNSDFLEKIDKINSCLFLIEKFDQYNSFLKKSSHKVDYYTNNPDHGMSESIYKYKILLKQIIEESGTLLYQIDSIEEILNNKNNSDNKQ